jgi:hypothetical protein
LLDGHDVGPPDVHPLFVTWVTRAGAGASPFPQCASSCTLTQTVDADPAENVPLNEKLLSRPKCPLPTGVKWLPSYEAETWTLEFVRDVGVASAPVQAVAT